MKVGEIYRFTHHHSLKAELRGMVFTPIRITERVMHIKVYRPDGSIITRGGVDHWNATPPFHSIWDDYLDKSYSPRPWGLSKLEFKFLCND